jgi:uncharacterized membrane protein YkvI
MPASPSPVRRTRLHAILILFVIALIAGFFGFTDVVRVTEVSPSLFGTFLLLLIVAVVVADQGRNPAA